jgi:hypothetical protein
MYAREEEKKRAEGGEGRGGRGTSMSVNVTESKMPRLGKLNARLTTITII